MKKTQLNPSEFNLSPRTVLVDNKDGSVTLIKNRKSRIIMKDGEKILDIKNKVLESGRFTSFVFETNAPLCSKTKKFLENNGIRVVQS